MRKTRNIMILSFVAFVLIACSQYGGNVKDSHNVAEAVAEARSVAKRLANMEFEDSMQLQNAVLEAKAKQSRYLIDGDTAAAEAFDSAFISLLRIVNPQLASKVE